MPTPASALTPEINIARVAAAGFINRRATPDVAAYRRVLGSLEPGAPAWLYVFRPRPASSFLTRVYVERRP